MQVDQARVLAGLALHLTGLVVALLDGGGEVTVGRHHQERDVGLGGTRDHVLDEVAVTRRIDDGVVPLLSEELLGGARDGHTTLALLLLAVHVDLPESTWPQITIDMWSFSESPMVALSTRTF